MGLSIRGFIVGRAALKAVSCKVTKLETSCIETQHVFISFAFDTFGFLAHEAVELLNKVQRVMNSNVMTQRYKNVVFQKISFAIQKGLAAQLIARLPSITIYKVAIAMPSLDELLKDTPTHEFLLSGLSGERQFYPTHYSELIRLAALY
ncbi:hypothetical protein Tco_0209353 [Tanacetum coccineum]